MRWGFVVALFIALVLATVTSLGISLSTHAQESTPAAEQAAGTPEGATFRALAAGSIEVLAPSTANLVLGRISLAPGASIPLTRPIPRRSWCTRRQAS